MIECRDSWRGSFFYLMTTDLEASQLVAQERIPLTSVYHRSTIDDEKAIMAANPNSNDAI